MSFERRVVHGRRAVPAGQVVEGVPGDPVRIARPGVGIQGEQFAGGLARVERRDQRLDRQQFTIVGAGQIPGLESMGGRHVPRARLGRLVMLNPQVDTKRHPGECSGEVDLGAARRRPG